MSIVLYDSHGRPLRRAIGFLRDWLAPVAPGPDLISSTDLPETGEDELLDGFEPDGNTAAR